MRKATKAKPFDIKLTAAAREQLESDLCHDIEEAFAARSSIIEDDGLIDLADWFYEQGRSAPNDLPFDGAADLTSPLITQDVDSLRARLMKAVFGVRPMAFVEGRGQDAARAPIVEAFMDWQLRKTDLKLELGKTILGALIEDCYVLEVSEKVETKKIQDELHVALQLNEQQQPVFSGESGDPLLQQDDDGEFVPAPLDDTGVPTVPAAKIARTQTKTKRLGPQYDAISMKDFVFLPGHAKNRKGVYGYAYRIYKRIPELQEAAEDGIYDEEAVEALGTNSERNDTSIPTSVDSVAASRDEKSAEKELLQLSIKRDLDGDGREEWYIATLSLPYRKLLRLKVDTFAQKYGLWRCVPFVLFPRRDSIYGYSFAFNKLLTIAEEHTALRNMKADRSALATNAPMTVLQTALWDPDAQPIGVGRTIPVRDHNEVKQLDVRDVPPSVIEQEHAIIGMNERVSGLSDAAVVGVTSDDKRTATENRIVAGGSGVRVDEIVGYLHLALAEVMAVSLAFWIESLESDKQGIDAPASVLAGLSQSGNELANGKFTAAQLKGDFQFEPYGSDENADPARRQQMFANKFIALGNLGKTFPAVQSLFMNPDVGKTVVEEWARNYDVRDLQPFLNALTAVPGGMMPAAGPMGAGAGALPPQPGLPQPGGLPPDVAQAFASLHGAGGNPGGTAF